MENYTTYPSSTTYPESGESSPRSREIEFENPPPWEEQNQSYKAKFMCSYGGKIQPRSHDNQLSYVGGETKILAVDRSVKFPVMLAKLSALCDAAPADTLTFKYQLPGEDLDALISVTNDDDLDHMMHEYDRLYRPTAPATPSRMRLFLFLSQTPPSASVKPNNNVDFLFGLDKSAAAPPPKFHDPLPPPPPPEYSSRLNLNPNVAVPDPSAVQRQLQHLQLSDNEQPPYRRKSDDTYPAAGDYFVHKAPENLPPAGYWPEKRVSGEVASDGPVYMIPPPGATFYPAPMMRPPAAQGYYAVPPRMASDGYREAPVYGGGGVPAPKAAVPAAAQTVRAPPAYTEGFSVVRPGGGMADSTGAPYTHVAYDSASGRQVYYTAPGGVVHAPPYQGVFPPPVTADMRPGAVSLGQDVKVINKVSQGSV
ncbi:hypothetical protein Fmac_009967 [Flemingia macrophylla]|uniref:PB1 domain-containing protein n=1 Tax=Flemingia macrophylla TaxID=520843 RepID=A0ABD1N1Q5_9FABA